MPVMAIEKFILDESSKEKRERALGRPLRDEEHGVEEKDEMKLQTIIGHERNEKLFGELLRTKYGADADEIFERFASENANLDDLKKINDARYDFQARLAKADSMGAGPVDEDIKYLAGQNQDFDAIAGLLENDKRTAKVIREHFYRLVMQSDTGTIDKIEAAQKKLRSTRISPEFKEYDRLSDELVKRYGFSTKEWSKLEEGNYTKKERREVRDNVWKSLSWRGRTIHRLTIMDPTGLLFALDPLRRGTKTQIEEKERRARDFVRDHLKNRKEWFVGRKTNKIMRRVSRLERVGVMDEIKTQFDFLGGVLAASISKDKSLLQALVREAKSKGAEEAQAIDKSKPMTFTELKSAQDQNEANYKNSFKAYLKQLRAKGADTTDQDAVIDNFHKQYGKSKNPGFFTELLAGLMRLFSNQHKASLKDPALWTP